MPAPWAALPREPLAALPTPLHPLRRFGAAIGAEVWIKRDDAGPVGLAGNKVRKLEFVLGAARADRADAIVIVGAEQSNACRAAAAACAQLGLRCVLVLSGDEPDRAAGNLLLDRLYGAEVRFAGTTDWAALAEAATRADDELRAAGATPWRLPAGASSPLGAVGFAVAFFELLVQLDAAGLEPAALVHASSSGGTQAGLMAGRRLAGRGPLIHGIGVAADIHPDMPAAFVELANGALALLGSDETVGPEELSLDMGFLGPGYAVPTDEANAAILLLARTEGIVCDPVYSGKALAALVAAGRAGELDGPVVFWHTGGWHALFAPRFGDAVLDAQAPGG
jgi:1-aminocyclopropane-1-carboxylate deaminase/D-cysteine desulfhydrase-like pyridoxal-dependent ACC family enzyme